MLKMLVKCLWGIVDDFQIDATVPSVKIYSQYIHAVRFTQRVRSVDLHDTILQFLYYLLINIALLYLARVVIIVNLFRLKHVTYTCGMHH